MSEKNVNEDNLQGSWVELHYNNSPAGGAAVPQDSMTEDEAPESSVEGQQAPMSTSEGEQGPSDTQEEEKTSELIIEGEQAPGLIQEEDSGSELMQAGSQALVQGVDLEKMLLDAQHESGRSSSRGSLPCDSPPRTQTPLLLRSGSEAPSSTEKNSSQSDEEFLERRREVENLMKKNADWIWDWSSRPENLPPRDFVYKHPKRTTPLSIRNTRVMKKGGIFSADFLKVFLPSLLLSHVLAIGLGVYIGRRLAPQSSSF